MNKWVWLALGLGGCSALVYLGFNHRGALFPGQLLSEIKNLKAAILGQKTGAAAPTESAQSDEVEKTQEKIAESIAHQQALNQQVQKAAFQSLNEVQRTLKSIEDINRINRQNEQMRQPQQPK